MTTVWLTTVALFLTWAVCDGAKVRVRSVLSVDKSNASLLHSNKDFSVHVATFDTGIAKKHPSFAQTTVDSCEGFTTQPTCEDGFGHGSFVAGTIAGGGTDCPGIIHTSEDVTSKSRAHLHIYKVFTDEQISFTSWFLDAFNRALAAGVEIINLSIGGADYFDRPFIDKVREVSGEGVTIVTAIGNDGPNWGTCYNPADQLDVIGVGSHTAEMKLSYFSSRGMTTWELPFGIGRPKPDVITYGANLWGPSHSGGCKMLSGTSVASPVLTGLLTLVIAELKERGLESNPAMLKQILHNTAKPIPAACGNCGVSFLSVDSEWTGKVIPSENGGDGPVPKLDYDAHRLEALLEGCIYAQGAGSISSAPQLIETAKSMTRPAVTIFPSDLRLEHSTLCPAYLWPHCDVPMFHTSKPLMYNLTVLNSFSSLGRVKFPTKKANRGTGGGDIHDWRVLPQLHVSTSFTSSASHFALKQVTVENDANTVLEKISLDDPRLEDFIEISVEGPEYFFPWAGSIGVAFRVAKPWSGSLTNKKIVVEGDLTFVVQTFASQAGRNAEAPKERVSVPFSFAVTETPPKKMRILWDMTKQAQFPPAYIPKDNIKTSDQPLDLHGDHPYLNFRHFFHVLRRAGFSVEVNLDDLTQVNGDHYGTLLIVDPEETFYPEEVEHLKRLVDKPDGMSLLIFSDWYDVPLMDSLGFTDDNTGAYWKPITGGANVPALNRLLMPFGIELSTKVFHGGLKFNPSMTGPTFRFESGGSISRTPQGSIVCRSANALVDESQKQRSEAREERRRKDVDILSFSQILVNGSSSSGPSAGRIGIFTDTTCVDSSHNADQSYCVSLMLLLARYAAFGDNPLTSGGALYGAHTACRRTDRSVKHANAIIPEISLAEAKRTGAWGYRRQRSLGTGWMRQVHLLNHSKHAVYSSKGSMHHSLSMGLEDPLGSNSTAQHGQKCRREQQRPGTGRKVMEFDPNTGYDGDDDDTTPPPPPPPPSRRSLWAGLAMGFVACFMIVKLMIAFVKHLRARKRRNAQFLPH